VVIVAVVAYLVTGHRGIYPAQRVAHAKLGRERMSREVPLRDWQADDDTTPSDSRR